MPKFGAGGDVIFGGEFLNGITCEMCVSRSVAHASNVKAKTSSSKTNFGYTLQFCDHGCHEHYENETYI